MNKIELINGVAIEAGISKAQAKAAVDAAIKVMTTALVKGDKIALVGFGTLAVQEKAERKGVNPSTGAPITIPAKKVVKFKPSAELAEKVKQYSPPSYFSYDSPISIFMVRNLCVLPSDASRATLW